ncbi:MAG: hydrogenase maturation protease [Terracidiphilus sp.]
MQAHRTRVLILACGNTLRSDDGVGPWLADWAQQRFSNQPEIRVISRQQWTPDLAEDIANAESVLFIDCSVESAPGSVSLTPVTSAANTQGLATHHQGAPQLLAFALDLYRFAPRAALLLAIGAGSTELGEAFSPAVTAALPETCRMIEVTVLRLIAE